MLYFKRILSFVLNYAALEHDSIILGKTRECWTQRISNKENMKIFLVGFLISVQCIIDVKNQNSMV